MSVNGMFKCVVCNRDGSFDQDWLYHVSSLSHQRVLARRPGGGHGHWEQDDSLRKKALTLIGCHKIKASSLQIAEYLTKFGRLEEFVCPTSLAGTKPENVYCLYANEDSVEEALKVDNHQIFREPIKIVRTFGPAISLDLNNDFQKTEKTVSNGNGNSGEAEVNSSLPLDEDDLVETEDEDEIDDGGVPLKLEEQLAKLFQKVSSPTEEFQVRSKLAKEIQEILRQTFSSCYVYAYGTDSIGVGVTKDAARLCIDPYGVLGDKTDGVIQQKLASDQMSLNLIFQIFSTYKVNDSQVFKFVSMYSVSPMSSFNIPEISFTYKDIPCKVRFENFMSLQKSRVIKFLTKHDIRAWSLLMILRHWSSTHNIFSALQEGEDFENHILILLLVFYLTNTKVMPSVAYLQGLSESPLIFKDIDASFCNNTEKVPRTKLAALDNQSIRALSTLSILQGFFKFFSEANLKDNVVCVATGELVAKNKFKPPLEKYLPEAIQEKYRFCTDGALRLQKLNTVTPMCIQDPIDVTDNVARNVDSSDLALFQELCLKSKDDLSTIIESSSPSLKLLFVKKRPDIEVEDGEDGEPSSKRKKSETEQPGELNEC